MEQSIRAGFGLEDRDVREISSLSLAFLGDSVYELVIRTLLVESGSLHPDELSRRKARLVNAHTQAVMADSFREQRLLTKEEEDVCRRGRNAKPATAARHASWKDYRKATGFECLMAYLYLTGQETRLVELVRAGLLSVRRQGEKERTSGERGREHD